MKKKIKTGKILEQLRAAGFGKVKQETTLSKLNKVLAEAKLKKDTPLPNNEDESIFGRIETINDDTGKITIIRE